MPDSDSQEVIVHSFPRGEDEEVRLAVHKYMGRFYIDLRVWFQDEEGGGFKPSRKGISIPADRFEDLKAGMDKLIQGLEKGELIPVSEAS